MQKSALECRKFASELPRNHQFSEASPPGPPPGLRHGPIWGLKAAPKPPASIGVHIKTNQLHPCPFLEVQIVQLFRVTTIV